MNENSARSDDDTEQNGLIYIYWAACSSCGYTTAVHGRVKCPYCEEKLSPYEIAGEVADDESRSTDSTGDLDA